MAKGLAARAPKAKPRPKANAKAKLPRWAGQPWREEFAAWVAQERRPGGELYDPRTDPTL